jgi:hypothetical protein
MLFAEIWLKWWTEPSNNGSRKDNGLYYGVYVALLSLYILAIGLDCWSVAINLTLCNANRDYCVTDKKEHTHRFMFVNLIPRSATWLHRKLLETTLKYLAHKMVQRWPVLS